jgi:nucleoside-diphosphate-sugar epimerase
MSLVLVTGATGRIGSALVRALLARKDTVRAVVRPKSAFRLLEGVEKSERDFSRIRRADEPNQMEKYEFDLSTGPLPKAAFDGVHKVIHLAGLVGEHPYNELVRNNAFATKNLLAACPTYVHRVVIASSISIYGEYKGKIVDESFSAKGESDYGKSKLLQESFARPFCENLHIVFLRFGMVYGPGFEEGYYPVLSYIKRGKMKIIGDGSNRLPLLHINDAIHAIILALDSKVEPCREYNIVGEEKPTQKEMLEMAAAELGVQLPSSHMPAIAAKATAKALSLFSKPKFTAENIRQLSLDRAYSTERAKAELGFEAKVKLATGLKEVVKLYLESEKKGSV